LPAVIGMTVWQREPYMKVFEWRNVFRGLGLRRHRDKTVCEFTLMLGEHVIESEATRSINGEHSKNTTHFTSIWKESCFQIRASLDEFIRTNSVKSIRFESEGK